MSRILKRSLQLLAGLSALALTAAGVLVAAYMVLAPGLPSVEQVRNVQLQVPLRVYTADGKLIDEFGERWRTPVQLDDVPDTLIQAFLAAEDRRFRQHPGVDYQGLMRAVWYLVRTGEIGPGGSTITMQLARNLFLTREQTYIRKIREIFLALRIERELDKDTILELYLNKIFLGQRAYGVQAAAEVYYGRSLSDLTLAEQAMIAGLPKAPSTWNPIASQPSALQRRAYVLGRMRAEGFIDEARYQEAMEAPVTARRHRRDREVSAPYVAEMARQWAVDRYGAEQAYTGGYRVFTTISAERQAHARAAVRRGLHAYDERHGYRGPLDNLEPVEAEVDETPLFERLAAYPRPGGLQTGRVQSVDERSVEVFTAEGEVVTIPWGGLSWARPHLGRNALGRNPDVAGDILTEGDVIHLRQTDSEWRLAQVPEPQAALISLAPEDGRMEAVIGGYDFADSRFNRATQARRQPGSAFKPLVYSAALEAGMTPATLINDAPVVFSDAALESVWRPENYSGRVFGPTRLRESLIHSRNLVSIRVLREIGVGRAIDHMKRYGLSEEALPANLSLALGSGSLTPLELARAYAVFANGGYLVEPYFIDRVEQTGEPVYEAYPTRAADPGDMPPAAASEAGPLRPAARPAERIISERDAWQMRSMLEDVVTSGTARSARRLGRSDLAGKTGTTNEQIDAWFAGFNSALVTSAWVGFDELETLGQFETGSRAALPIWTEFMGRALSGVPEAQPSRPDGLVTVRIDPETGNLTGSHDTSAIFETFREEYLPAGSTGNGSGDESDNARGSGGQPIF